MVNVLKVAMQQLITTLTDRGWSQRRIARELDIDRSTVKRYIEELRKKPPADSKPAISTAGSDRPKPSKPAISTAGSTGRKSLCQAHHNFIEDCLELGLSAQRIVHRDGHVEVARAYYSVPAEYIRRAVWVRWDNRFVRIYGQDMKSIAVHAFHEPGQFSTAAGHIPAAKISGIERGAEWMLKRLRLVGPHTDTWARAMMANRGVEGLRTLQGLLSLTGKFRSEKLEAACRQALAAQSFRLRDIRELAARTDPQMEFSFLEEHPLIRQPFEYGELIPFPDQPETEEASDRDALRASPLSYQHSTDKEYSK